MEQKANTPQIEVHRLAQFLASRSAPSAVVVLTRRPELVTRQYPPDTKLFIASPKSRQKLENLETNAQPIDTKRLDEQFLQDKILVCIDYLEARQIPLVATAQKKWLRKIAAAAAISIVAVEQSKTWQLAKLKEWFGDAAAGFIGKSRRSSESKNKDQLVAINGKLANFNLSKVPLAPVLAVVPAYNERDMIAGTVDHLLKQGVDVHVIDNWSTDGSYEIVQSLATANPKRVSYERFPAKAVKKWEWFKLLTQVTEVAKQKKNYKWIMLNDADELRWSPWTDVSLQQAFSFVGSLGYNAVDYTVFTFKPTIDGFGQQDDPADFFSYGEFAQEEAYFIQVKSWMNSPKADLATGGGHHVAFARQRIYPFKFLLGHYPLRSTKQAHEKVFKYRKPRLHKEERDKGWNVHYDDIPDNTSFISDKAKLLNFSEKTFWEDYLLERISGISIERK